MCKNRWTIFQIFCCYRHSASDSILGPFLFIVMMNDLAYNVSSYPVLYADGTSFLTNHTNFETLTELSNNSMQGAEYWYLNKLVLNKTKSQCLNFSLRHVFDTCDNVSLLGLCLDSKLLWSDHITGICNKLLRVLYVLHKIVSCITTNIFQNFYYFFLHFHLLQGVQVWGNSAN